MLEAREIMDKLTGVSCCMVGEMGVIGLLTIVERPSRHMLLSATTSSGCVLLLATNSASSNLQKASMERDRA